MTLSELDIQALIAAVNTIAPARRALPAIRCSTCGAELRLSFGKDEAYVDWCGTTHRCAPAMESP